MLPHSNKGVVSTLIKRGGGSYTACLSGVLARGKDQFGPLVRVLPGNAVAYHTTGQLYHLDHLVHDVVANLWMAAEYDYPIQLIGASMGGMQMPFVVERFRMEYPDYDLSKLRVVLVDAPCGLESLVNPLAKLLRFAPLAQVAAAITPFPFPFVEPPKPDEITVGPYRLASGGWSTQKDAKKRVMRLAKEHLSGHSTQLFLRHTRWMIKVGADGSLERVAESLADLNVTYVACQMNNEVVRQPLAVDWWSDKLSELKVLNVEATHCGFLQNTPEFEEVFRLAFNN